MEGAWPAGHRLDTARLANQLGVSKSPVRDSLNRLAGERLVEFSAGAGFQVPVLDRRGLVDLLDFNLVLMRVALAGHPMVLPVEPRADSMPADRASEVFRHIAQASGSGELVTAVELTLARLGPVLRLDQQVLTTPFLELDGLQNAIGRGQRGRALAPFLRAYHVRRKARGRDYVHLLGSINSQPIEG